MRRINEPKQQTPNSYTWAQLVVFYLQCVEPPVLPCLQALRGGEWTDAWPCDADSLPSLELLQLIDPDQPAQLRVRVRVRVRIRVRARVRAACSASRC